MKSVNALPGNQLRWVRPKGQRHLYELRSDDEVFVTVKWRGASCASTLVESANGSWTITRHGLAQTVTIKDAGPHMDLAAIKRGITGSVTLALPDGRVFRWRCASFWRSTWSWEDADGRPLLHLKRGTSVQLEAGAQDLPELALLLTLGWYLYKQQQEEAALVGSMVASMGG
jgi:hypothetical protein